MAITFEDVVTALIDDFRSMHEESQQPDVRLDFEGDAKSLAKVAEGPIIRFSHYFSDSEVENQHDLFYCLIVACHELAHWTNAHIDHTDQDALDSKAIESWADFYGTRLLFTAITAGSSLNALIKRYRNPAYDIAPQKILLTEYGNALRSAYDRILKPADPSPEYPAANERVMICGAGVASFFYRLRGELNEGMTLFALKKVMLEPFDDLEIFREEIDWSEVEVLSQRMIGIHMNLKQGRDMITPGIRPEYNKLIGTHYLGYEENAVHRQQLKEKIREWGVEV